jgi:hypothetical protein
MKPMEIGVVYPQNELLGDPTAVRRIGRAAEDLGFSHLLAYDTCSVPCMPIERLPCRAPTPSATHSTTHS